jgi:hypothetical protein
VISPTAMIGKHDSSHWTPEPPGGCPKIFITRVYREWLVPPAVKELSHHVTCMWIPLLFGDILYVCIYVNKHTCVQVVPGQAGSGSFKFEALIAYRAEQRLCL